MPNLDPRIEANLRDIHDAIGRRGQLPSVDQLNESYASFRKRFGPERLRSLDGDALLQLMHSHGNKESLVYWLEFKNDTEFPGTLFGSIAGGSAHKFGLFRRKETGQWVTGSPQNDRNITQDEAVVVARKHRDQLLAGVSVLEQLPANADDSQYRELQDQLSQRAPDISDLAWAHKYFYLLFPDKLDDYHNHRWQRFNLIKLLQMPPEQEGLYVAAGRFVSLAAHFNWPVSYLTSSLNERNGQPISYWRIGTRLGDAGSIWAAMREGGYAAIGWDELGDLSTLAGQDDLKERIRERLEKDYPSDARTVSRKAGEIKNFVQRIAEGDVVLAVDGQQVLGVGRVTGPYRYENRSSDHGLHRRAVTWMSTAEWNLPEPKEGIQTTVFKLGRHENNLIEIERRVLDGNEVPTTKPGATAAARSRRLEGVLGRIQAIVERKGQAILYGPPGTGKTFWARKAAFDLAALQTFGRSFNELSTGEKSELEGSPAKLGLVCSCTFHPAYGYEDFIEGFRPALSEEGHLSFELRDGIFKRMCIDAREKQDKKFFLLIDEINRGDIPRIFGELLTLLEIDKRGVAVSLPVSRESFSVPANVHLIGTMNTADRSIALLDTALRRRFGFLELMPDVSLLGTASVEDSIPLGPWLSALNDRIRAHLGRDARNLQVGHAYLLDGGKVVTDFARFVQVLAEDIIPLLEEYCYEDYPALSAILGKDMVEESQQRVRYELFSPSRRQELVHALLAPAPEIETSPDAVGDLKTPEEIEESVGDSEEK